MIEAIVIAEKILVAGCGFRKIVPLAIKAENHRSDPPRHDRTRRRPSEADRDIGIPARQADGAAVAGKFELDPRISAPQRRQARRDKLAGECGRRADPHHACQIGLPALRHARDVERFLFDARRNIRDRFAFGRKAESATGPFEKSHAKPFFERRNTARDRAVFGSQSAGCGRERPRPEKRQKIFQIIPLHLCIFAQ